MIANALWDIFSTHAVRASFLDAEMRVLYLLLSRSLSCRILGTTNPLSKTLRVVFELRPPTRLRMCQEITMMHHAVLLGSDGMEM